MPRLLLVVSLLGLLPAASAQESLLELGAKAAELPTPKPRYLENVKFGIRGVTFTWLQISKVRPETMYATSADGFVYATHDGGVSWIEGRLTTGRGKFFGAIRPRTPPTNAGFNVLDAMGDGFVDGLKEIECATQVNASVSDYLDLGETGTVRYGTNACGLSLGVGLKTIEDAGGGGGGGDASRFGVGIVSGAPRLMALLKRRRARLVGLNLKLLINIKGVEPTWVNHVAIHPTDPSQAMVASAMGVFRTRDGGLGWEHIFSGRNNSERWCNFMHYDHADPKKVWLGTNQGLLVSYDGGDKFERVTGTQLSSAAVTWMEFYRGDPQIVYAGTHIGVFKSTDGGQNWKWVYFETLQAANFIFMIAIDPNTPDRVQIATKDGLFRSRDGGANWERSGGFLFTSAWVPRLISDPRDSNHVIASDWTKVWETWDWGETWRALYINDSDWTPRGLAYDPRDPSTMWITTSAEILKLTEHPPQQPDPARLAALRQQLAREPGLSQVMDASFRTAAVHRGELSALRSNARWASLVPRLHVYGGYIDVDLSGRTGAAALGFDVVPGGGLAGGVGSGFFLTNSTHWKMPYFGAFLTWNLANAIFHMEEAPFGRYFGQANHFYLKIKVEVQRLYEERRRVLIQMVTIPPDDLRANLALRLRLEELTAHLNQLTAGLYEPQVKWLESLRLVQ